MLLEKPDPSKGTGSVSRQTYLDCICMQFLSPNDDLQCECVSFEILLHLRICTALEMSISGRTVEGKFWLAALFTVSLLNPPSGSARASSLL